MVTKASLLTRDSGTSKASLTVALCFSSSMRYSFCWVCLCWSIVSKKSASLFPEDAVLCVTDVWSRYWSVIGGVASAHGGTSW